MTENSKRWQDNSDGWVAAMTKSKQDKEKYQEYLLVTENPVRYTDWLKDINKNDTV
jgi:hypothetical protein